RRPTTGSSRWPSSSSPTASATRSPSPSPSAPRACCGPSARRPPAWPRCAPVTGRRSSSPSPASTPRCSTPGWRPARWRRCGRRPSPAGPRPAVLHRRFTSHFGVPLLDGIGTTEALHIFCSNRLGAERPGTSGTPVDGYELKLVDDDGVEVTAPDTPGALYVKGESGATGYWGRTATSRQVVAGDWMRTGDTYARSADGYYTCLGRSNDMIKPGGIWVSPAEVEAVLVEHSDVLEAAVVGARNDDGLEEPVAFVVARSGAV